MDTVEISAEQIREEVKAVFHSLVKSGEVPVFSGWDANRQRELVENVRSGVEDFFEATFPKHYSTPPSEPSHGSYKVIIGSYHFALSNSAWEIFKHCVALIAAFTCIAAGDVTKGGLGLIITTRELVKTLLSNFHALSPNERTVVEYILQHSINHRQYPTKDEVLDGLAAVEGVPPREGIETIIQELLGKGVLTVKDEDRGVIGIGF